MALGEASVRIVPDTAGFAARVKKDVDDALNGVDKSVKETTDDIEDNFEKAGKEASQAVDGISKEFKKLGKLVAGAAIGRAVFSFAKDAIAATSDLGESINAVQVTFGELSDEILAFSKTSATAVGLSSADFNSFAVQFAGFTKQVATGSKSAAVVTEELTTRIADFASVMNLDLNEAAVVFASTLAGETEPIRRFGKDMSAASVEAFALATGMIKSKDEMTAAIKVQATYAKLMADTAEVAGDFANTSESLANRQRTLAAEFKNMQAEVGTALVPILSEVLGVAGSLISAFTALPEGLQKMVTFAALAGGAFLALSSALQGVGMAAKTANIYVAATIAALAAAALVYSAIKSKGEEARIEQEKLTTALKNAGDPTANLVPQMEALANEYNRLNPAAETATDGINSLGGAMDYVRSANLDYLPILKEFGSGIGTVTTAVSGGTDAFQELRTDIEKLSDSSTITNSTAESFDRIAGAINNVLEEGDPMRETLLGIAKSGDLTNAEFMALLTSLDETADAFDDNRGKLEANAEAFIRSEKGAKAFAGILGEDVFNALIANAQASADAAGRSDEYTYLLEQMQIEAAKLGYVLDPVTQKLVASADATDTTASAADAAKSEMIDYVKSLGFVVSESGQVEMSQENLAIAVDLAQQRFDDAVQAVEDYEDALSNAFDAARSSIDTGFALVESQQEATTALAEYAKAAKSGSTSSAELDQIARDTAKTLLAVADNTVTNAEALAAMNGESLTTAQRQEMMNTELQKFAQTLDPASPLYQYLNGFIATLGTVPTEIPIEMQAEVDAAKTELETFKEAAKEIGTQITLGILEALAPLSPEFQKMLDKMKAGLDNLKTAAKNPIVFDVRVVTTTSGGDIVAGREFQVNTPTPPPLGSLAPGFNFGFANGGIFDEPQIGLFAEAGAEAIIPLTRPARALELMRESGLLGLAQQSSSSGQNFDITVVSAEPMRTAKDVVREFQALEYRMGPL